MHGINISAKTVIITEQSVACYPGAVCAARVNKQLLTVP